MNNKEENKIYFLSRITIFLLLVIITSLSYRQYNINQYNQALNLEKNKYIQNFEKYKEDLLRREEFVQSGNSLNEKDEFIVKLNQKEDIQNFEKYEENLLNSEEFVQSENSLNEKDEFTVKLNEKEYIQNFEKYEESLLNSEEFVQYLNSLNKDEFIVKLNEDEEELLETEKDVGYINSFIVTFIGLLIIVGGYETVVFFVGFLLKKFFIVFSN